MAGHYNLQIRRGADFGFVVDYTDDSDTNIDLRGYHVVMQVRRQRDPKSKLLAEFSTENGNVVLDRPQFGEIILNMDGAQTYKMPVGDWYYDLVVYQRRPAPKKEDGDNYVARFCRYTVPVLSGMVTVIDTSIDYDEVESCG